VLNIGQSIQNVRREVCNLEKLTPAIKDCGNEVGLPRRKEGGKRCIGIAEEEIRPSGVKNENTGKFGDGVGSVAQVLAGGLGNELIKGIAKGCLERLVQ
jgi:hypothetical protein